MVNAHIALEKDIIDVVVWLNNYKNPEFLRQAFTRYKPESLELQRIEQKHVSPTVNAAVLMDNQIYYTCKKNFLGSWHLWWQR